MVLSPYATPVGGGSPIDGAATPALSADDGNIPIYDDPNDGINLDGLLVDDESAVELTRVDPFPMLTPNPYGKLIYSWQAPRHPPSQQRGRDLEKATAVPLGAAVVVARLPVHLLQSSVGALTPEPRRPSNLLTLTGFSLTYGARSSIVAALLVFPLLGYHVLFHAPTVPGATWPLLVGRSWMPLLQANQWNCLTMTPVHST